MKLITAVVLGTLSFSIGAQTFTNYEGPVNFTQCQKDQLKMYDHILTQYDNQLKTMGNMLEEHVTDKALSNSKSFLLNKLFQRVVEKKAIMKGLKDKFAKGNLDSFIKKEAERRRQNKNNSNYQSNSFMDGDLVQLSLEKELTTEKEKLKRSRAQDFIHFVDAAVVTSVHKDISNVNKAIATWELMGGGLLAGVPEPKIGPMYRKILSSYFINVAKGTALTLIVDPLMGSRRPAETEWTDLLEKHPDLIVFPEWMEKANVGDGVPWLTHCKAASSRTELMERSLGKFLKNDQKDFDAELYWLIGEFDPSKVVTPELDNCHRSDNTRVNKPTIELNRK